MNSPLNMPTPAFLRKTQTCLAPADTRSELAQAAGDGSEVQPAHPYRVELATHRLQDASFCARWRELLIASKSPQQIYQSPAFFRFLLDSRTPNTRSELLVIVRQSDNVIEGVIPVMIARQEVSFAIGKLVLFCPKIPMIRLLGSIPAVSSDIDMVEFLAHRILALFPEAKSIFMQALPIESDYWRTLATIDARQRGLATALMGHWRGCHTMPLPASFEQYVEKFSAKKRYNLNRQIRQLEEQAGKLALVRVERTDQVGAMLESLAALVSPAEFSASVNPRMLAHLATQSLLCCQVLRAGGETLAVIVGTRSAKVWHIDKIFVTERYRALSVGTSAMHLAVKDIIVQAGIEMIDFGYGSPKHDFSSSHVLETRGQVLLFDRKTGVRMLFFAHSVFLRAVEALLPTAKRVMKKLASTWRR